MSALPDPDRLHPLPGIERVFLLRPLAAGRPNVDAGRYAYADDPLGPEGWFDRAVLHHYAAMGDRLGIGPFCAIADGVRIVMNGAAHDDRGLTTFPFQIFGGAWGAGPEPGEGGAASRGDTVIGPDVWIGHEALILPGARIGAGAVVGARAVVSGEVPPYTIVAGNPARPVGRRVDEATADRLLALAWWDWAEERIARAIPLLHARDLDALEALA